MLKGKVIIITGASQGLGFAMAKGCAENGATVIMTARTVEKLEAAANELKAQGGRCIAKQMDVTKWSDVDRVVDEVISEFGRIDGLVNNAGWTSKVKFLESTIEDYDKVMNANLKSVYMCCRKVCEQMAKQKYGSVVNISSVAAETGGGLLGTSLYASSKGGIISMTKGLARELAQYGIRVNTLAPGCIDTPTTTVNRDPAEYEASIKKILLHRRGRPEDVVASTLLLLSDNSSFITGTTLDVNGGVYMR